MSRKFASHPVVIGLGVVGSLASIVGLVIAIKHSNAAKPGQLPVTGAPPALVKSGDEHPQPEELSADKTDDEPVESATPSKSEKTQATSRSDPWTLAVSLVGHEHYVTSLDCDPAGKWLVSGSYDATLRVWDMPVGDLRFHIEPLKLPNGPKSIGTARNREINSVDVSPKGTLMASGDSASFCLWNLESGQLLKCIDHSEKRYKLVSFSPDGTTLAVANNRGVSLFTVDGETAKAQIELEKSEITYALAWHASGEQLATAGAIPGGDSGIVIWDTTAGIPKRTIPYGKRPLKCVAYSPNGRYLASGAGTMTTLWDTASGKIRFELDGHGSREGPECVTFSSDSNLLAVGSDQGIIAIWDVKTGEKLHGLRMDVTGPGRAIRSLVFSPDGSWLAAGCGDGVVRIWTQAP